MSNMLQLLTEILYVDNIWFYANILPIILYLIYYLLIEIWYAGNICFFVNILPIILCLIYCLKIEILYEDNKCFMLIYSLLSYALFIVC